MGTSKGAPTRNTDPIAREKNPVAFLGRNAAEKPLKQISEECGGAERKNKETIS